MQTVDIEAMGKLPNVDIAKPPMKSVPDDKWPILLYRYPKEAYRTVQDKPSNAASVERLIPNPAKTLKVFNQKEMDKAIKEGWKTKAFVHPPVEEPGYQVEYEETV
jgi:hypothetical protein